MKYGVDSAYTYTAATPTTAFSYDNKERDVSKFYEPAAPTLYVNTHFLFDTKTLFNVGIDSGYISEKKTQHPRADVKITQFFPLGENTVLSMYGMTSFGGTSKDKPCRDEIGREYYCGALISWQDYTSMKEDPEYGYSYGINIKHVWF